MSKALRRICFGIGFTCAVSCRSYAVGQMEPGAPTQMAGTNPAIAIHRSARSASIQRFDLDDGGAVIVADPEHGLWSVVLHEDAPDIGWTRHQVLGDLAA